MAAHPNVLTGEPAPVPLLSWSPRKIRRVVRSSIGAECAAFSTVLDHAADSRALFFRPRPARSSF